MNGCATAYSVLQKKTALYVLIKNLWIAGAFGGICGVPLSCHIIFQIPGFFQIKLMYSNNHITGNWYCHVLFTANK